MVLPLLALSGTPQSQLEQSDAYPTIRCTFIRQDLTLVIILREHYAEHGAISCQLLKLLNHVNLDPSKSA